MFFLQHLLVADERITGCDPEDRTIAIEFGRMGWRNVPSPARVKECAVTSVVRQDLSPNAFCGLYYFWYRANINI